MNGKELKEAMDHCDKNCQTCPLFHTDWRHHCQKQWEEAWKEWAKEQHRIFGERLKDE